MEDKFIYSSQIILTIEENVNSSLNKLHSSIFPLNDSNMPVMDGPSSVSAIRALGVTIPIFGVTGNGGDEDIKHFISHGVTEVSGRYTWSLNGRVRIFKTNTKLTIVDGCFCVGSYIISFVPFSHYFVCFAGIGQTPRYHIISCEDEAIAFIIP